MRLKINYTEKDLDLINVLLRASNEEELIYDEIEERDITKKWITARICKEFIEAEFSYEFLTDVVDLVQPVAHYGRKIIDIVTEKFETIVKKYDDDDDRDTIFNKKMIDDGFIYAITSASDKRVYDYFKTEEQIVTYIRDNIMSGCMCPMRSIVNLITGENITTKIFTEVCSTLYSPCN